MTVAALNTPLISDLLSGVASIPTHCPSDAPTPLIRSRSQIGAPDIEIARTTRRPESGPVPVPASYLHGLSLFGIAQMLQFESKTCLLEVTSGTLRGTLVFVNGNLIDATFGQISGNKAVELMLGWHEPTVWIYETTPPHRMTVTKPVAQLLLESLRRLDESAPDASQSSEPVQPSMAAPQPLETTAVATLVADAERRLDAMARTTGVLALALIHAETKTVLGRATASPEWAEGRLDAEIADVVSLALLVSAGTGEVRIDRQSSRMLIFPLDPARGIVLYLAMKPSAQGLTRTARRISRQAAALIA